MPSGNNRPLKTNDIPFTYSFMNRSLLQIHTAVFLWGFTGILGRIISLGAPMLVGYRMLFTCLILCLLLTAGRKWVRYERKDFLTVLGVGVLFAIHWFLFFQSIKLANASIAMLCLATASVFIAILQPLIRKTTFQAKEITIGLIALAGVGCIYFIQPAENTLSGMVDFQAGVIYGVLAAILSAVFTIFNKPLSEKYPSQPTVFWEMLSGFVVICLTLAFTQPEMLQNLPVPHGQDLAALLFLAVFCTVIAQSLALKALKKLDAFTVTLSVNLEPIYGMIFAFLIFRENEQLNWGAFLGIGLILASLVLQVYNHRRQSRRDMLKG